MAITQAETFLRGEGNAWLKRNLKDLPIQPDPVIATLGTLIGSIGDSILEIGCANGWRLKEIQKRWGCTYLTGVDPSENSVTAAKKNGIDAIRGFAHSLSLPTSGFDVVIYGFCLYVCDREHLFAIAAEGDRVLRDGGLMVIHDFTATHPHKNPYRHRDGLWSYKQDYAQMFLWNPAYTVLTGTDVGRTTTTVLRKSMSRGWPECE